ncbi:MAG: CAAX prenyl protease-related protein [Candidatus Woesearchaeota archaeon]
MNLAKGGYSNNYKSNIINYSNIYAYIIPFAFYVFLAPLLKVFIKDDNIIIIIKVISILILLLVYREHYRFTFIIDFFTFFAGLLIFIIWIGLEGFYPLLGTTVYIPQNTFYLIVRIISAIIIAPIIEEFFVRFFLNRIIIKRGFHKWNIIPVYKFTVYSFVVTVLFFGFSHNRWLPGLMTGIILNIVLIKTKKIDNCIIAHIIANILVVIFVILTESWNFW